VLNGPDTLRQLLAIRASQCEPQSDQAEFYVIGRVRMRMGFDWVPVIHRRKYHRRTFTERGNCILRGHDFMRFPQGLRLPSPRLCSPSLPDC